MGHLQQGAALLSKLWTLANTFFDDEIEHGKARATVSHVDKSDTMSSESDLDSGLDDLLLELLVTEQISSSVFKVPALQNRCLPIALPTMFSSLLPFNSYLSQTPFLSAQRSPNTDKTAMH